VLNSSGSGSYAGIADGIYFAAANGARVISMSLGGSSGSTTLENALAYAHGLGVTIVCASGNDGSATVVSYPAAYDAYCLAIGATRYDEAVAGYSNRGASLDLTAPGGDTSVDQNGDGYVDGVLQQTFGSSPTDFGYYFYQGTSMATPHVSGVAALLLAQDPSRTPDQIRAILQATAKDKGPAGWDPNYGWGILDAAAALNYAAVANQVPVAVIGSLVDGTEDIAVGFDGSGSSDGDSDQLTYRWDFGDGTSGSGVTPSHAYAAGGRSYTVTLVVNDGKADSAADSATLWINEVNDPPVADAGPVQTVLVNQAVQFDASGSYDIDDGIVSYAWAFGDVDGQGDGATGLTTSHTYQAAGVYTVTLTVADNAGLTDSDETVVTVSSTPVVSTLSSAIDLVFSERATRKNTFVKATARVHITDAGGPVDGVAVSGFWSDAASSIVSATTDATGQVSFDSAEIKNPAGGTAYTFTVTQTEKSGYASAPGGETSDTIIY
ncbi:MAG: PKD domain-containing protein, partial [Desulfuromonadales bacterium]|nr:PKD domain-containing protein [Desulfuromonadales bacterium]